MGHEVTLGDDKSTFLKFFFPLIVACGNHQTGLIIGWSAMLPKMQSTNATSFTITQNDITWLVSSQGIVGMGWTLFIGPLVVYLGPRRLLFLNQLLTTVMWITEAFSPNIIVLYIARFGLSLCATVNGPLVPFLVSELSDSSIRGFTLAMCDVSVSFGILVMYLSARFLEWKLGTVLCSVSASLLFIGYFFVPESPYWLVRQNLLEEAKGSLQKVRASKLEASNEMINLETSIGETKQQSLKDQIRQLKVPQNYRAILLLLTIFVLRELGGEFVIFTYSVYIFQEAGVQLDAFTCTVIIGTLRLICSIVTSVVIDFVGRRPLIIATTLICASSTAFCGISRILDVSGSSWITLGGLLVYVTSYSTGLGPIPWALTGEMIPTPVRSIGGPICIFGYSMSLFITCKLFPLLIDFVGLEYVFIIFTVALFVLTGVLLYAFPETKGKTLIALEKSFKCKDDTTSVSVISDVNTQKSVHRKK